MNTNEITNPAAGLSWKARLMSRSGRRWLVVGLVAACVVLLLLGILRVQSPFTLVLIAVLIADDMLLLYVTSRVSELPETAIDERQQMIRNRAYRVAYRIVVHALIWPALLIVTLASFGDPHGWLHALWSNTPLVIALGTSGTQLLVFLPTMILAWTEPEPIEED
jgi:hypothetical protein